ncbi:MAG: hypothetical protein GTO14_15535 [Anaerolineales bacterium]|nr:hypothetical protein [Anaerolineales bacterium]
MSETQDFERYWHSKFSNCILGMAGAEVARKTMGGSEALSSSSGPEEIIRWTQLAMTRLEELVGEELTRQIMTGCACSYPSADLQDVRKRYEKTRNVKIAHQMLQSKFESFLRGTLGLEEDLVEEVVSLGWGLAGEIQNDKIIATKIPKSGFLEQYVREEDPERRKRYYCHCPRVREALALSETIPTTYCYCGAGFYKGIWEEILQVPVEVEVLETVLHSGDVCKIAIHLPQ